MSSQGLSAEAKAWAIESIIRHVEGRWFERQIRGAPDERAAVRFCQTEHSGYGRMSPDGRRLHCHRSHVDVAYPDGSTGRLSWLDVVRYARGTGYQLTP